MIYMYQYKPEVTCMLVEWPRIQLYWPRYLKYGGKQKENIRRKIKFPERTLKTIGLIQNFIKVFNVKDLYRFLHNRWGTHIHIQHTTYSHHFWVIHLTFSPPWCFLLLFIHLVSIANMKIFDKSKWSTIFCILKEPYCVCRVLLLHIYS